MAKGKKTGGKNFAPGNNLNPLGRPRVPEVFRAVRIMTQEEVAHIGTMLLENTIAELKIIAQDRETTAYRAIFARALVLAYERSDLTPVDRLLDRIIGRVKDSKEKEVQAFIEKLEKLKAMPVEERLRLARRAIQNTHEQSEKRDCDRNPSCEPQ